MLDLQDQFITSCKFGPLHNISPVLPSPAPGDHHSALSFYKREIYNRFTKSPFSEVPPVRDIRQPLPLFDIALSIRSLRVGERAWLEEADGEGYENVVGRLPKEFFL